ESLLLGSIEEVISQITLSDSLLQKVARELKYRHVSQHKHYSASIKELRREYDVIDNKLGMWWERLVDDRIEPEKYDIIVQTLTKRQEAVNDKLDILTKGNKDFLLTCSYLLDLANRAEELFKNGNEAQRSKLLSFLLSNSTLNDKKLTIAVNYPYSELIPLNRKPPEGGNSAIWCG
ncbi:MAG TPA: hypothetical protein VFP32_03575, partial [Candidatus Saccharimonadales bacterium]|nr:hypothetical protein [Candidatus Saccharimonadales bacterium]